MTIEIIRPRKRLANGYVEPALGRCHCGQHVALRGFTNTCDCGRDYNMSGQLLASRDASNGARRPESRSPTSSQSTARARTGYSKATTDVAYEDPDIDWITPRPRTALDRRVESLFRAVVRPEVRPEGESLEYGVYGSDDPRGYIEPVLHEIAHVVVLRRGVRAALRRPLTTVVGQAVPVFPEHTKADADEPAEWQATTNAANQHEIDTIAVEIVAAKRIGMTIEPSDIAEFAIGGANLRDLGNVDTVAALICAAMKRPEIRRWAKGLGDLLRPRT